jgi:hypothetical protein
MLVEAKALGEDLEKLNYKKQVMGYTGTLGAGWAVLTNGDEYRVFNATGGALNIEERLFHIARLTDPNSPSEEILALLSRERIGHLQEEWADKKVSDAIRAFFSPKPHSHLLNYVESEVAELSAEQIEKSVTRICARIKIP